MNIVLLMKLYLWISKGRENNQEFFIAFPEKALTDYFHLNTHFNGEFEEFNSLRLQNLEILNIEYLETFKEKYNRRMKKVIITLLDYIKEYKISYKNFVR